MTLEIYGGNTYRQVCPDHQFPKQVELRAAAAAPWVQKLHNATSHRAQQEKNCQFNTSN
jgi:hypothetical protein